MPIFSPSSIVKVSLFKAGASFAKYLNVTSLNSSLPLCGQSLGGLDSSLDSSGGSDKDDDLSFSELEEDILVVGE